MFVILDGLFDLPLWKYFFRPFKWWFRKDKKSDNLSYAMSIEAIPNPQGWITGAIISFYCQCDVTKSDTAFERILNLKDEDVLYTKSGLDEEEIRLELAERIKKYINLPLEADYARRTINMQVMIEGAVVWSAALTIASSILVTALTLLAG